MESILFSQEKIMKAIFPQDFFKKEAKKEKGLHQLKFEKINNKTESNRNLGKLSQGNEATKRQKRKSLKEIAINNSKLTDKFIPSYKKEDNVSKCDKEEIPATNSAIKITYTSKRKFRIKKEKIYKEVIAAHADTTTVLKSSNKSNIPNQSEILNKSKENNFSAEQSFCYSDLSELSQKDSHTISEMILIILEIALNSKKYGLLSRSNTTVKFWCEVFLREEFKNLFKSFQPETIRKYWRVIREIPDHQVLFRIIQSSAECFNSNQYKLLTVLRLITSSAKKISTQADERKFKENLIENVKRDTEENVAIEFMEDENDKLLEIKRSREVNKLNNHLIKIKADGGNYNFKENTKSTWKFDKKEISNYPYETEKYSDKISTEDITDIIILDELLIQFEHEFSEISRDKIFDTLKSVSFNVEEAYLVLADHDYFQSLAYDEREDYIIKNMKKLSYFKNLLEVKGVDSICQREAFLTPKHK